LGIGPHLNYQGEQVDEDQARARISAERADVQRLLKDTESQGRQDRTSEDEQGADISDPAQPLTAQFENDAIAANLRDRLAALDGAEQRLDDGTYGLSVQSGQPIPDERLEADPTAELTIEEARAQQ
jgi:DnaK suppressor protein